MKLPHRAYTAREIAEYETDVSFSQVGKVVIIHVNDRMVMLVLPASKRVNFRKLLLLGDSSCKPENNNKILYTIARAPTLIALQRLSSDMDRNKDRKGHVIQFLCETGLIKGKDSAVRLERANLVKASFHGLNLSQVNLRETRLSEADMICTDLSQAILQKADLARASLISANWSGADLSGANLSSANLSSATITREQWEKAKSLKETIMPKAENILKVSRIKNPHSGDKETRQTQQPISMNQ